MVSFYRFIAAAAVFGALATFFAGRLVGDVAAGALAVADLDAEAAEVFLAGATFVGAIMMDMMSQALDLGPEQTQQAWELIVRTIEKASTDFLGLVRRFEGQ